ncbi:MAG TPA: MoaD/ThiS family protein [Isosphaeraceae bacterium]|jgi:elongation factor Ts|nr:MoaD/ThiS family protein [Isosphaeraceae bacterium]
MAVVRIPTSLRPHTGGQESVEATGATVGAVLRALGERYPALRERIFEGSELRRSVNVYLNNKDIRHLEDLGTPVADKDEVSIIPSDHASETSKGESSMAEITAQLVNELRKLTGLGLMECKALLKETGGDLKKAATLGQERGVVKAAGRAGRAAKAGRIETYIHHNGTSGAMIELNCETDFVARNEEFRQLAKDLAMHIVAANPQHVRREDVPADIVAEQKRIFMTQAADKPEPVREKIADGKLNAWYKDIVLLEQPFAKDDSKAVKDLILAVNSRTGENISIARFARFVVGEGAAPATAEEPA